MVWIQCEKNADNPPLFWFLLSRVYLKSRTFILCVCVSHSASEKLHKRKLGRSIVGTGDLNWPNPTTEHCVKLK